jgi:nitroreductase
MDLFETVKARRSVRAFVGEPLSPGSLDRLLEAVNLAPSAGDLQAYEVYLVQDGGVKEALVHAAYDQVFIEQAPAVLVFCANPLRAKRYGERGASLYAVQDATIAAAYAQLAATALGLATVWVGAFDEDKAAQALRLPAGQRPLAILPVGKAAESPAATPRRSLEELVHRI